MNKYWGARVLSILAGIVFAVAASEASVRALHLAPPVVKNIGPLRFVENRKLFYEFIPGSMVDGSRINSRGFKDTGFEIKKGNNEVRIAMIGDSITQGFGVRLGETFSDQLEILLNRKAREAGIDAAYNVMNFGVCGYNLEAEVELLKIKALEYKPDIVILNFFHNDNDPIPGLQLFFADGSAMTDRQKNEIFIKYAVGTGSSVRAINRELLFRSKLYAFIVTRFHALFYSKKSMQSAVRQYHKSIVGEDDPVFFEHLAAMLDLSRQHEFRLLICIHPHLLWGEHPNNFLFESVAGQYGITYFRMMTYYEAAGIPPHAIQLNKEDRCHPNAMGHKIAADALFLELKHNNYIDRRL